MAGSGVSRLVIGKVLNHIETGVMRIYDRHGYDAEKRAALELWDRALTGILAGGDGRVLPFVKLAETAGFRQRFGGRA